MKKTTVSMLITALILFCSGLLLSLITLIYTTATGTDIYSGQGATEPNIRDYTKTFADMGFTDSDVIKKIDFSFLVGEVEVRATQEESRVEFFQTDISNIVCKFENNTVTVKENNSVGFMGFEINENGMGFNGLRQLFRSVGNASLERKAVLYLNPNDFKGILNVKCIVGSIACQNLACTELNTQSTFADVAVFDSHFQNTLNIKGTTGDVFLRKNTYLQCKVNVTGGKIYSYLGANKSNLETTMGDILILTEKGKEDYQLRLSNTSGSIRPFDLECNSNEFSLYSETGNSIWAKSVFGSITVEQFDAQRYPELDFSVVGDLTKFPA